MHRLEQRINAAVLEALRVAGYEGLSPSHVGFLDQMGVGCRMGELARRLGVTRAAVSQLADQLEALGLIERMPDDDDRRAVVVIPTEAVRRGWAIARAAVDGVEGRWRAELGERRFRAMADAITRLVVFEDADVQADRVHARLESGPGSRSAADGERGPDTAGTARESPRPVSEPLRVGSRIGNADSKERHRR